MFPGVPDRDGVPARTVRSGLRTAIAAQIALLAGLALAVGLTAAAVLLGLAYAGLVVGLLSRGMRCSGTAVPGPADRITLVRAVLVGGVAALVAESFAREVPRLPLVVIAAVALVLDAVDGRVARRTGTVSPLGARFDVEVDSALVFLLGLHAAQSFGPWVVAIGSMHYLLLVARRALPWLRRPAPPRYWCKVVAAVQGITLTVVVSGVLPPILAVAALGVVAALLAESFGREVVELRRMHRLDASADAAAQWGRLRSAVATVLAAGIVWAVLAAPDRLFQVRPEAFVRIPVEGLLLAVLALMLPRRAGRVLAVPAGLLVATVAILRVLDLGFRDAVSRPFNPVVDWRLLDSAGVVLGDSVGTGWAVVAVVGAALLAVAAVAVMTWSVVRLFRVTARHRAASGGTVGALAVLWSVCAVLGAQLVPGVPVASVSAGDLAAQQVGGAYANLRDLPVFRAELAAADPWGGVPPEELLTGLRGKDVVLVFVESYGRVALEGSPHTADVRDLLGRSTQELRDAGFGSRSAFLTSPTFGGISWLAHATLQSGLWVDSQQRHDQLFGSDRSALSSLFARAGWRTVADVPSNRDSWPEGEAFYELDRAYGRYDVGYAGPKFIFAAMPDQYTLAAFERLELAGPHPPVMAELDLISSHQPWTPLPRLVDWADVGDGSVFDGMPAEGQTPAELFGDDERTRDLYSTSIRYSLSAVLSWITTYHRDDDDLVVVLLGDHQPAEVVSGPSASHDVPISVLAGDPGVLDAIASWGWDDGLLPSPAAPVWRMDAFRDRFLAAYGPPPAAGEGHVASRGRDG